MKKKFSTNWKASKKPRKQRKYVANAPLHLKRKQLNTNLSKELRKKYGRRSVSLKKGDVVKIIKGKFKGKQGKVSEIKTKKLKIFVEGIQVKKQDGSKKNFPLKPSSLRIIELSLEKRRGKLIENKNKENKKSAEKKTKEKSPENKSEEAKEK